MAGRYPSIVFHFTNKVGLEGILRDNFKIFYARERLVGLKEKASFGVPMVSFCDLRVSELESHMKAYGQYGIGLSKEWATRNSLSPVSYWSSQHRLVDNLLSGATEFFAHVTRIRDLGEQKAMQHVHDKIMGIYQFIKNYDGELWRHGKLRDSNFRFANEREWRYVPPWDWAEYAPIVPASDIATSDMKRRLSKTTLGHLRLKFEPKDIRYLVVRKESQRAGMIELVNNVKSHFSERERQTLASRILTAEQIRNDV